PRGNDLTVVPLDAEPLRGRITAVPAGGRTLFGSHGRVRLPEVRWACYRYFFGGAFFAALFLAGAFFAAVFAVLALAGAFFLGVTFLGAVFLSSSCAAFWSSA